MSTPEEYMAAHEGRVGADRMQLGLSIIPDKLRGDMEVVAQLRARLEVSELARQACELREKHHFERIERAEAILFDLGTGYWVAILDDNDDPVTQKMGQRVLQYWMEAK